MVVLQLVAATALLSSTAFSGLPLPPFSVVAPRGMVTGSVLLEARSSDKDVAWVKWIVGDWAKTTGPPFTFTLDVGTIPQERRIRAVALDRNRRPRYQQDAVVNRGGRGLHLAFVHPVAGANVSGTTSVVVRVEPPRHDPVAAVSVEIEGRRVELSPADDLYGGVVDLPAGAAALVARARTQAGREAELPIVLNTQGFSSESEVCIVEQLVGVYRKHQPIEGLSAADFHVKDDRGDCEIRNVEFVRDAPLSVGFAVDASLSLAHAREFLKKAAGQFLDSCFRPGDAGFVAAFGPVTTRVVDWSSDKARLKTAFEDLPVWHVAGTQLYEAVVDAVYRFQGSQGARALFLLTDGFDYQGDVTAADALAYARQSGVKIYALALPARHPREDHDGQLSETRFFEESPNVEALEALTSATGGRTYPVRKVEELPSIFAGIERDLRSQYLVSFVARARPTNAFHPVTVKTNRGAVQTAAGYFH